MTRSDDSPGREHGRVQVFPDPDYTLVMLSGEVDLALADELDAAHAAVVSADQPVRLDVYQVGFMDSIGVGFIGRLVAHEHAGGRRLDLVGASKAMRETLIMAGIADRVDGLGPRT